MLASKRKMLPMVLITISVVLALTCFGAIAPGRTLHFVHSTILNQYLYAWDKEMIPYPVSVETTVVQDPGALGVYLMGLNPADLVEVATVFAGIAHTQNPEVRIVASLTKAGNADSVVVVRAESGITGPEDLKGRTIGTPGLAMTPTVLFRELLKEEYGVGYDEVRFILKPLPMLLSLLEREQVDAVIVFNIFAYQAAANPNFEILMDIDEHAKETLLGSSPIAAVLASTQSTIGTSRSELEKLLGAIKDSHEYALLHKEEIAENLASDLGLDAETYQDYAFRIQPANILLTDEEKQNILQILAIAFNQSLLEEQVDSSIFW